jgi:hypothetical protein
LVGARAATVRAGVLRDGLILSVGSRRDWLFTGWKGGEMVFCHRVAAHAQPPAQGQPCKELISCLRPRVL